MISVEALGRLVHASVHGDGSTEVIEVGMDSRTMVPGSLFCCVPGAREDGHEHAGEAVRAGAVALLCERELPLDVAQLVVSDARRSMAVVAASVHGNPSRHLDVIGVTGTNGKTTVVSMVKSIMSAAGVPSACIGTLTGERTTPESPDLQRLLAGFVHDGVRAVAIEVSSHALALHRVDEVDFAVAVFTNLGTDHLDFHGTQEAYFAAKAKLFDRDRTRAGVVDIDDVHGRLLVDASEIPVTQVTLEDVTDLRISREGSRFRWHGTEVLVPMHGLHNVSNALLAAEACLSLDVGITAVVDGLAALEPVPGRFETFDVPGGATAVVDYAHTPDALEQILRASRALAGEHGKVTVVFGCGGDRDRSKRPLMGRVAGELADRVVITTDNPRGEDPNVIAAEVVAGVDGTCEVQPDREQAIRMALVGIGSDDVVVIAGKGHEQGQVFNDRVLPFDDRSVLRDAIARAWDQA